MSLIAEWNIVLQLNYYLAQGFSHLQIWMGLIVIFSLIVVVYKQWIIIFNYDNNKLFQIYFNNAHKKNIGIAKQHPFCDECI